MALNGLTCADVPLRSYSLSLALLLLFLQIQLETIVCLSSFPCTRQQKRCVSKHNAVKLRLELHQLKYSNRANGFISLGSLTVLRLLCVC